MVDMIGPLHHAQLMINTVHAFGGIIEITGLPPKSLRKSVPNKQYFVDPNIAAEHALNITLNGYSAFVGVNPKKAFTGYERDVAAVVALPLDLQPERTSIEKVVHDLTRVGLAPTIHSSSGWGAHLFLCLDQPYPCDEAKLVSERLCKATGSDAIFNVNRVMRIPGTINWKREPVWCEIKSIAPERRYTLAAVTRGLDMLGALPVHPREAVQVEVSAPRFDWLELRARLSPHAREIIDSGEANPFSSGQQTRSETDYFVIADLVRAGATDDQIVWVYNNCPIGSLKFREAGMRYLNYTIERARVRYAQKQEQQQRSDQPQLSRAHRARGGFGDGGFGFQGFRTRFLRT